MSNENGKELLLQNKNLKHFKDQKGETMQKVAEDFGTGHVTVDDCKRITGDS